MRATIWRHLLNMQIDFTIKQNLLTEACCLLQAYKAFNCWGKIKTQMIGLECCLVKLFFVLGNFFMIFLSSAIFFQNQLFQKILQEYNQSVKQFESRSGLALCQA